MSPTHEQQATEDLRRALRTFSQWYPYHTSLVAPDYFSADPRIETMCVFSRDGRVAYHYNPRFVVACEHAELVGVIHHEVNHWLFGHPRVDPRQFPDRSARLVAEEVTVNEFVPEPLPGEPILLKDYPFLPAWEDTATRYHRLVAWGKLPRQVRTTDDHTRWRMADELSPEELHELLSQANSLHELPEHLREAVRRHVARRTGRHGRVERETLGSANVLSTPLHWPSLLERAAGFSPRPEATFGRPPRRLPHLVGCTPGRTVRGHRPRILAAIDTSRSMNSLLLQQVRGELFRLADCGDVTVVECDTDIRARYPLRDRIEHVAGRGGTDLRPVFEPSLLAELRPQSIVYFTDGAGPAPEHAPRVPVIWCLTAGGRRPVPWGVAVELPAV